MLACSWFGLLSKRAKEANDPSVVDERVKVDDKKIEAAYDEVEEADT